MNPKINGGQFILYLFFGPETLYLGNGIDTKESARKTEYMSLRRIDPTPFSWFEFIRPLTMARHPSILLPACAYAMVFLFGNILATVEIPQLLEKKFELNAEQLGLQFLGAIIGSVIGEQMGGVLSDFWMNRRSRRIGGKAEPEFRLWLSYFGFALTIIGMIVFLVCTQESPSGHWNVTPIIGTAIGAVGNQLVTTVMITYAIDCFPQEAGNIGVFITFVRQIWGFLGPFWYVFFLPSILFCSVVVNLSLGLLPCSRPSVSLPARALVPLWLSSSVLFPPSSCTGGVRFGVARSEGTGGGIDFGSVFHVQKFRGYCFDFDV
jgi:hypothetical protein